MFKKKYFLIFPQAGRIFTAQACRIENDFVIFEAINFRTREHVNTQWINKAFIEKITEYNNWEAFANETNKLILAASEDSKKAEEPVKPAGMTEEQVKAIIKQFPSKVPTVESIQEQATKES